jgi:hypothetical protein
MHHQGFFAILFSFALFLLLTCAPTNDPYDPSNADVSLFFVSSGQEITEGEVTDTVGKNVRIGVRRPR